MKTLNLKYISFSVGDWIVHKDSGYTAKILKFCGKYKTEVEIPYTPENQVIWHGYQLPHTVKLKYIAKTFKKQKHGQITINL